MKFILSFLIFVSLCQAQDKADDFFKGNHDLLALNSFVSKSIQTKSEGNFFLFVGSYSSETTTSFPTQVSFCWKNNKREYMVSSLPMDRVRFQMDSSITKPYCKFKWKSSGGWEFNEDQWLGYVLYAVFVLKPEQVLDKEIKLDLKK